MINHSSNALKVHYIIKTLAPFENELDYLSGEVHAYVEQLIKFYSSKLKLDQSKITAEILQDESNLGYLECLLRLVRSRFTIERLCCRYLHYHRNTGMVLNDMFETKQVMEKAMEASVEVCKSIVALLSSNFSLGKVPSLELDSFQEMKLVQYAKTLN